MTIVTVAGLAFNFVGTLVVCLCASRVMICIHTALTKHDTTLEAHHSGRRDFSLITGLDESRNREMTRSSRLLRLGLWLVTVGFALQVIAIFC